MPKSHIKHCILLLVCLVNASTFPLQAMGRRILFSGRKGRRIPRNIHSIFPLGNHSINDYLPVTPDPSLEQRAQKKAYQQTRKQQYISKHAALAVLQKAGR